MMRTEACSASQDAARSTARVAPTPGTGTVAVTANRTLVRHGAIGVGSTQTLNVAPRSGSSATIRNIPSPARVTGCSRVTVPSPGNRVVVRWWMVNSGPSTSGGAVSRVSRPCSTLVCRKSTLFSITSCGWESTSPLHQASGRTPTSGGSSHVGGPPSTPCQTNSAPSSSRRWRFVREARNRVPSGEPVHEPSGPNAKPWNGQTSSSPRTVPPAPKCAPRCGQCGPTARTAPRRVRYSTTSSPVSRAVRTRPGGRSRVRPTQNLCV